MNAQPQTKSVFFPGQKLSDRSACDHDCVFRATVIKRTAKRVTLDLGRGEIKTVGIFIDYNGHEACFPFGRYSMASIFSAGDKFIPETTPAPTKETATAEQLAAASLICGEEVCEILSGAETLTPANVIHHAFR
jgi:hypothetical protein